MSDASSAIVTRERRVARDDDPYTGTFSGHRITRACQQESPLNDIERLTKRKIDLLPTSAESFYDHLEPFRWELVREILVGIRQEDDDDNNNNNNNANSERAASSNRHPLALLRNHETTLLRRIFSYVSDEWARYVRLTIPAPLVGNTHYSRLKFVAGRSPSGWYQRELMDDDDVPTTSTGVDGFVSFSSCGVVEFPEPTGRNVNMMPFVFGDKESLPDFLQCYHNLIEACPYMKDEIGNVGYLTVHESWVDVEQAQRREGLHIESPGVCFSEEPPNATTAFTPGMEHSWGVGYFYGPDRYEGGIYMASNIADTSQVWDALVDKNVPGIVDKHGGCEHLRHLIGEGTKLEAGELIWMTDCTPHEALPQAKSGYRQFFRVVTPCVSHWYADHSTPNPKVPLPDHVTVVHGNKFL